MSENLSFIKMNTKKILHIINMLFNLYFLLNKYSVAIIYYKQNNV